MNREQLIQAWYNAKKQKDAAAEAEKSLRLQIAEEIFKYDPDKIPVGTEKYPLQNGFKAKMTFKANESLEQKEVGRVKEELQRMGIPAMVIAALFKPKWSTVKAIYEELPFNAKALVNDITNRSSATPVLEIVEPPTTHKKGRKK